MVLPLDPTGVQGKRSIHLVVNDMIMERSHCCLPDGGAIALLRRLPVTTLQVAGSREADFDGAVYLENVIKYYVSMSAVAWKSKPN